MCLRLDLTAASADWSRPDHTLSDLVAVVDARLYEAKQAGRGGQELRRPGGQVSHLLR
jgi:hypothetical protein